MRFFGGHDFQEALKHGSNFVEAIDQSDLISGPVLPRYFID